MMVICLAGFQKLSTYNVHAPVHAFERLGSLTEEFVSTFFTSKCPYAYKRSIGELIVLL
jgi:hypothetical protein